MRRRSGSSGLVASLLALGGLGLTSQPASALQVIDARDGVAVEAILSIKEPTRIRIEGAPIVDVFGNIHSSQCGGGSATTGPGPSPINPAGEVVIECDRDKGEIYVRPVPALAGEGQASKPVNLFVSSAHATYTLILRRSDTPADTILIRDRSASLHRPGSISESGSEAFHGPSSRSANHVRAMKALLVAMVSEAVPQDVRVDDLNTPVRLWAEARFLLTRRYQTRSLVGEKYLLVNTSPSLMVLAEQEFDRPDSPSGGQVLGVSIEHHQLRPGDSTHVFVIRRGGER